MRIGSMTRDTSLDIAVTGIFARFPGCDDLEQWWNHIKRGSVLTKRYERQELLDCGVAPVYLDDPDYVPVGGHLNGANQFDNKLFGISPRDAELMDPQHRLMIEAAWSALEDAGSCRTDSRLSTTVYASGSGSGYLRSMLSGGPLDPETLEQALHGTEPDFIASLIAYKLNLRGGAMAVQTACSSSLVAVHLGVQALLNGECDQALVVAAGVAFPQGGHIYVPGGIKSRSGQCRPFDKEADGVVEGGGVACVVLRRLEEALLDGPEPYGVIIGSAVNNDGASKAGYYAPSASGQEAVIRAALGASNIDGSSIGYLETHGTGTRVGDPIEWEAASAAFKGAGADFSQIAIGALKANIGHLDAAAGLASMIKCLRVVKEGVIPPVASVTGPNPLLETEKSPLFIPTKMSEWTGPEPRRACVSAFGIGGTNAHVVLEQPPASSYPREAADGTWKIVALSAADPATLQRQTSRLCTYIRGIEPTLSDVAFTLARGRNALSERLAIVARDCIEAAERIEKPSERLQSSAVSASLIFLFPGQGSQRPGMAIPFANALPGFEKALQTCLETFSPDVAGLVARALIDPSFPAEQLNQTELAQPALFALEYAAARALVQNGLTPVATLGHSLGEITAACVAGILSLSDAANLVTARGRAMQRCSPGAMLSIGCDEGRARALVAELMLPLEVAAVNSRDMCVISGPEEAIDRFFEAQTATMHVRRLPADRAFHSALIEPALPDIAKALEDIQINSPKIGFVSNSTGCFLPAGTAIGSDLFLTQARGVVRFAEGLEDIARHFSAVHALEVGTGRVLTSFARASGLEAFHLSSDDGLFSAESVLKTLARLWASGHPVRLEDLTPPGRLIHLPTYPFAGPSWMAPEAARQSPTTASGTISRSGSLLLDTEAEAAASPVELNDAYNTVSTLWTTLLGHQNLNEESDFFDLGGDSLLVITLARKISQNLGIEIPLREMLAARTLRRQSDLVAQFAANAAPHSTQVMR
jgi:phthiocerol/phenolphthiocerol synthesis type-I polyketide synthase E